MSLLIMALYGMTYSVKENTSSNLHSPSSIPKRLPECRKFRQPMDEGLLPLSQWLSVNWTNHIYGVLLPRGTYTHHDKNDPSNQYDNLMIGLYAASGMFKGKTQLMCQWNIPYSGRHCWEFKYNLIILEQKASNDHTKDSIDNFFHIIIHVNDLEWC